MASLWRRAMVYLGLQDDDELDYAGEYDSYMEYPDEREPGRDPGARQEDEYEPRAAPREPSGSVRMAREVPSEYVAADPPRMANREEPSGITVSRPAVVRTIGPTTTARVHVVEPDGFNDAQEVGDRLKANQPVILNLQGIGRDLQRRLIDFSSGLAYAVGGSMARVADQVFLITPSNVEISQEEKERLQARGLFQA
jgi:cell division inhibitor SepF